MNMGKASITIENMEGISTSLYKASEKGSALKQTADSSSKVKKEYDTQVSKEAELLLQKAGLGKEIPKPPLDVNKVKNPKIIHVQYNPTSLKFSSRLEKVKKNTLSQELQEVYKRMGGACSFEFSASLIFSSRFSGDVFVNEQVEQFMAFLLTSNDRIVTFAWGEHFFKGVMTSMNAKYTQFDRMGNPTYATVDISISGSPDIAEKKIDSLEKERNAKLIP